jgi:periplasmic divalent cation tolerance protein
MVTSTAPTGQQVTVTAPSEQEASALGEMAVRGRLAACAQVSGPIVSSYWWEGRITTASEWVCTLKTSPARLAALMAALAAAHSYEVPEIIATEITGDPTYLSWVEEETRESR